VRFLDFMFVDNGVTHLGYCLQVGSTRMGREINDYSNSYDIDKIKDYERNHIL
jgi:hypothetical protein